MGKLIDNTRAILKAILLISAVNSCSSYYYVCTDVGNDLSVSRMVFTDSDDVANSALDFASVNGWNISDVDDSFNVDFYDESKLMKQKAVAVADDISKLKFYPSEVNAGNPIFYPEETLSKNFRWFYTYFEYKAGFKSIEDILPLPLEPYLTDEQLELFFRGDNPPAGWNGIEMYCLLDDVNQSFARWYSDATYYVLCDIFDDYCDDNQRNILCHSKDDFMKDMHAEAMFAMESEEFAVRFEEVFPGAGFDEIVKDNKDAIEEEYERKMRVLDYFSYSFLYTVRMPGEYYDGNAADFVDGYPLWKVDAYRLMTGDLVFEAVSRKLNIWAFMMTFLSIALLLQVFAKVFSNR